jgi:hypothetical protein
LLLHTHAGGGTRIIQKSKLVENDRATKYGGDRLTDPSRARFCVEQGPDPALEPCRGPVRRWQVLSGDGEEQEQDAHHEEDEVEHDVVGVRREARDGGREEAPHAPRREVGCRPEAAAGAEPRVEAALARIARGAVAGVVVVHGEKEVGLLPGCVRENDKGRPKSGLEMQ